jgi:hypothetical protein
MEIKDKEARIRLFLQLIESFNAEQWVDNIYDIIKEYDLPKHLDRDFVLSALEQFYVKKEEYEKCANLVRWKEDILRLDLMLSETSGSESKEDVEYKEGFKVPDSIRQRFKRKRDK